MSDRVSPIEAEARAYVEAYRYKDNPGPTTRYLMEMIKVIDGLRAPPGADAMERAQGLTWFEQEAVARAIEKAKREARAAAIAEVLHILPERYTFSSYEDLQRSGMDAINVYRRMIRALAEPQHQEGEQP